MNYKKLIIVFIILILLSILLLINYFSRTKFDNNVTLNLSKDTLAESLSKCGEIAHPGLKSDCYTKLFISEKNISLCNMLYNNEKISRDFCYLDVYYFFFL